MSEERFLSEEVYMIFKGSEDAVKSMQDVFDTLKQEGHVDPIDGSAFSGVVKFRTTEYGLGTIDQNYLRLAKLGLTRTFYAQLAPKGYIRGGVGNVDGADVVTVDIRGSECTP